jgi:hypothetical protein
MSTIGTRTGQPVKRRGYHRQGVRELLYLERQPWALELDRRNAPTYELAGKSTVDEPQPLLSEMLPLRFRMVSGKDRPAIEVAPPALAASQMC